VYRAHRTQPLSVVDLVVGPAARFPVLRVSFLAPLLALRSVCGRRVRGARVVEVRKGEGGDDILMDRVLAEGREVGNAVSCRGREVGLAFDRDGDVGEDDRGWDACGEGCANDVDDDAAGGGIEADSGGDDRTAPSRCWEL
jgi:hypothetical protein